MNTYPIPKNEDSRLAELYNLNLLDTPDEAEYNSLAELVAFVTGCPVGLVSILDKDRQWFKAAVGLELKETSRDIAFCAHTIVEEDLMIVEDTTLDERFKHNPLVTGPLQLRFYAGVSICCPLGHALGTVCALDNKPRQLSTAQRSALRTIALQASRLIELRKKNHLIAEHSIHLLNLEKETIHYHMRQQEEERELVSTELHENFAQSVAASLHYLSLVEGNKDPQGTQISKLKTTLTDLLLSMCQLSKDINPVGSLNVGAEEKLHRLFRQYESMTRNTVHFQCKGDLDLLHAGCLSHLFRVLIEYLNSLESLLGAEKKINIFIHVQEQLELRIWLDKGNVFENADGSIAANAIRKRCELLKGNVNIHKHSNQCRLMTITIPID